MPHTYQHPRPAVTVDCVVFSQLKDETRVLLIQRAKAPFQDSWALPGGFMEIDETVEAAAARELKEETQLSGITLHQLGTFSRVDRDPRDRVISVAFWGKLLGTEDQAQAASDAKALRWFPIHALPPLAFDHAEILALAITQR